MTKRIRRRWTPGPNAHHIEENEPTLDEAVTELHILEEGISPPPVGRMATFGGITQF